jgi:hypothetical protein
MRKALMRAVVAIVAVSAAGMCLARLNGLAHVARSRI